MLREPTDFVLCGKLAGLPKTNFYSQASTLALVFHSSERPSYMYGAPSGGFQGQYSFINASTEQLLYIVLSSSNYVNFYIFTKCKATENIAQQNLVIYKNLLRDLRLALVNVSRMDLSLPTKPNGTIQFLHTRHKMCS